MRLQMIAERRKPPGRCRENKATPGGLRHSAIILLLAEAESWTVVGRDQNR